MSPLCVTAGTRVGTWCVSCTAPGKYVCPGSGEEGAPCTAWVSGARGPVRYSLANKKPVYNIKLNPGVRLQSDAGTGLLSCVH